MAEEGSTFELPVVFLGLDENPILHANNFVIQHNPDGFTLTVGQLAPLMLVGDEAERQEQLRQISHISIRVVGRFAIPPSRLRELVAVLQDNLTKYDQSQKEKEAEPND